MAISKEKKKDILEKLKKIAAESKNTTFLNFHGLTVGRAVEMRRKMGESKVSYLVTKKTLARKAFEEAKIEGRMPPLEGELGLTYSSAGAVGVKNDEDLLAPAREAFEFQKRFEKTVSILGGIFEGRFLDKEEMTALAAIPSLQILRGQFVNLISSPIRRLAVVLNEISKGKS